MPSKQCPQCGLHSHETAIRCDCGYDFTSGQVRESYLSVAQAGPVGVDGWLMLFCLGLTVFSPLLAI